MFRHLVFHCRAAAQISDNIVKILIAHHMKIHHRESSSSVMPDIIPQRSFDFGIADIADTGFGCRRDVGKIDGSKFGIPYNDHFRMEDICDTGLLIVSIFDKQPLTQDQ